MGLLSGRRLLVYIFLCAVWGSTWLAIRVGVRDLPPLLFAALRMGLAWLILTPLALTAARPTSREWLLIGWNGFLQIGLAYALIFLAARRIDSGLSAVFFSTFPIWVGVFAHFGLPDEPWTRRTIASALLGISGVAIIEAPAIAGALAVKPGPIVIGGGLVLAAAIASGLSNVSVKKNLSRVEPSVNIWGQTLVGSLLLFAASALFEQGQPVRWTPHAIASLAYLALFGTALTFVGLFWLIPRVPVAVIGTIPLVDTVVAVLLGALFLGERLSPRMFVGGLMILLGVLLAGARRSPGRRRLVTPDSESVSNRRRI